MVPGVDVRWSDYAGRYGIVCTPGTVIKGGDGTLYLCQWKSAHDQASTDGSTRHLCREYEGYPNAEFVAARRPEVYISSPGLRLSPLLPCLLVRARSTGQWPIKPVTEDGSVSISRRHRLRSSTRFRAIAAGRHPGLADLVDLPQPDLPGRVESVISPSQDAAHRLQLRQFATALILILPLQPRPIAFGASPAPTQHHIDESRRS